MSKAKAVLMRTLQCLFELLVFLPILLGIAIYIYPQLEIGIYFLLLFLLCMSGIVIRGVFDIRSRWIELPIGIGLIFSIIYIHEITKLKAIVFFILAIVVYFRGIFSMEADWERIFPRQMWWIALIIYMLSGFIYSRVVILKDYLPYIMICGFIQVIISLIVLNHRQLGDATLMRDRKPLVPSSIKRQNWLLIFITVGIITIIASFNKIKEFFKKTFKLVTRWIIQLIMAIYSIFEGEPIPESAQEGPSDFPFQGEMAPKNPILELILDIIGIVLAIIGMVIVIYLMYRGIKKLVSIISAWLRELFHERDLYEESYGYIDEKESLIDIKEIKDRYAEKVKTWIQTMWERQPKWKDLNTNPERIRYIYTLTMLKYLKEGYRYKEHMTPTEIGTDVEEWLKGDEGHLLGRIVPIYNRARYGHGDIHDIEVEEIYRLYQDN